MLPNEIISQILLRVPIADYVNISKVCSAWQECIENLVAHITSCSFQSSKFTFEINDTFSHCSVVKEFQITDDPKTVRVFKFLASHFTQRLQKLAIHVELLRPEIYDQYLPLILDSTENLSHLELSGYLGQGPNFELFKHRLTMLKTLVFLDTAYSAECVGFVRPPGGMKFHASRLQDDSRLKCEALTGYLLDFLITECKPSLENLTIRTAQMRLIAAVASYGQLFQIKNLSSVTWHFWSPTRPGIVWETMLFLSIQKNARLRKLALFGKLTQDFDQASLLEILHILPKSNRN